MNKILSLMLALCMALLPMAAFAEESADTLLEGFVTEVLENGFVMEDAELGEIQLNTSDATVWDGILTEEELAAGQYVVVEYDGRMTFSLPPQAHADRVGCHVLEGVVGEMLEDGFLLTGDLTHGDVVVRTEEALSDIYLNVPVTVYYDGVMTLSLPAQVSARQIVIPSLEGEVSELTEEGFLLTDEEGQAYQVLFGENTAVGEKLPEAEEEIIMEDPAEIAEDEEVTGEEAVEETEEAEAAEETSEEISEETGEETELAEAESELIELADGDFVTVYFNGAMTRSIPAQLTAIEILIHR